jgi:predicted nucleotidyltransferase
VSDTEQATSLDAWDWIDRLPAAVARQAAVLRRLLEAAGADPRLRALAIHGSVARGEADELSDLDTAVWLSDEQFDAALRDLPTLARAAGDTLDVLFERPGSPYLFVQFADGVQLELRAWRASEADGRTVDEVVLLDRDGLLDEIHEPSAPWDRDLWTGWAWMRLYDLDKYLRRGSFWEALVKLEEARTMLLRHHAAVTGASDPQLGLTGILDAGGSLPDRLEETVAGLDAAELRRAGHACAELLAVHDQRPFGDFVLARLANEQ